MYEIYECSTEMRIFGRVFSTSKMRMLCVKNAPQALRYITFKTTLVLKDHAHVHVHETHSKTHSSIAYDAAISQKHLNTLPLIPCAPSAHHHHPVMLAACARDNPAHGDAAFRVRPARGICTKVTAPHRARRNVATRNALNAPHVQFPRPRLFLSVKTPSSVRGFYFD